MIASTILILFLSLDAQTEGAGAPEQAIGQTPTAAATESTEDVVAAPARKRTKVSVSPAIGAAAASAATELVFVGSTIGLGLLGPELTSPPTSPHFWAFIGFSVSAVGLLVGPTLAAYAAARLLAYSAGATDAAELGWHAGEGDFRGALGGALVGATVLGGLGAFALGALGVYVGAVDGAGNVGPGAFGAVVFGFVGAWMGLAAIAPGVVVGAIVGRPIGAFFVAKDEIKRQEQNLAAE